MIATMSRRIRSLFAPVPAHVWKETGRENLGSFINFGTCPQEITRMYRIAVHEICLLTGDKRIREVRELFPVGD